MELLLERQHALRVHLGAFGRVVGSGIGEAVKDKLVDAASNEGLVLVGPVRVGGCLLGVLGRRGLRYKEERVELGAELVATQREVVLGDGVLGLCDALVGERRRSLTGEERGAKGEDLAVGRDVDVEIAVGDLEAVDELADVVVRDAARGVGVRVRAHVKVVAGGGETLGIAEQMLGQAGGDRVGVLGALLRVDVVDGGRVGVLASRVDATADGGHVGGRLDVGKHLVGVLGTPGERLAGGILGTRSAGVQESGIGDGAVARLAKLSQKGRRAMRANRRLWPC